MNMKQTAKALAKKGRYGDDMLVHMSKQEVAGLASLLPNRQLTRNPETGLHEAFNIGDILPTVLGAVATIYGGPMAGAAVSGALTTAKTGDLSKGLMAGLGSYGLGTLGAEFGSIGAGAGDAARAAGTGAATITPDAAAGLAGVNSGFIPGVADAASQAGADAASNIGSTAVTNGVANTAPSLFGGSAYTPGQMWQGVNTPGAFEKVIGDHPLATIGAASSLASLVPQPEGVTKPDTVISEDAKHEHFPTTPRSAVAAPEGYRPGIDPEWKYINGYADGGGVQLMDRSLQQGIMSNRQPPMANQVAANAMNGIRMARGGAINGRGTGMSDSIPAIVDGQAPAKLSSGEFVIPADVVSHLGDGSSEAGQKRLYALLDDVRRQKTGRAEQPRPLSPMK